MDSKPLHVASLGGGTGQPALIRALRLMGVPVRIDAVVAMADDGRSTGILRDREGILPPGDLRKCIVALAEDPEGPLARALEHRFPYLDNHALGNLLITALADEGLGFTEAIAACERLLGCIGRALPSTLAHLTISGRTAAGETASGQARLSYASGRLERVWLEPADAEAYPPAVEAIRAADLVVVGPGSLFTSLMPNLLVSGIARAMRETGACRLFVCPKADVPGETEGMDAEGYLDALDRAGFLELFDAVLLHRRDAIARPDFESRDPRFGLFADVALAPEAEARIRARVPHVLVRDLADADACTAHDPALLAQALLEVVGTCRSARR